MIEFSIIYYEYGKNLVPLHKMGEFASKQLIDEIQKLILSGK